MCDSRLALSPQSRVYATRPSCQCRLPLGEDAGRQDSCVFGEVPPVLLIRFDVDLAVNGIPILWARANPLLEGARFQRPRVPTGLHRG